MLAESQPTSESLAERLENLKARRFGNPVPLYDEAITLHEEAKAQDLTDIQLECLNLMVMFLNHMGRPAEALAQAETLLAEGETIGSPYHKGNAQDAMGNIYMNMGDFASSLHCFQKALALRRECQDMVGVALTLHNLAMVHYELGDYPHATELALQSLRQHEESQNAQGLVLALTNLGRIYKRLEDFSVARSHYQRGLRIARENNLVSLSGNILNNLGAVTFDEGDYTAAKALFEEAVALHREHNEPRFIALGIGNIGNCLRALGQWDEALACYQEAEAAFVTLGDTFYQVEQKFSLTSLYSEPNFPERDLEKAKALILEIIVAAKEMASVQLERRVYQSLSRIEKERGDTAAALAAFERFYELDKQIFNEERDKSIRALQILHDVEQARKEAEIAHLKNVELAQANAELERLNREDSLSGLLNRRALDERLRIAFAEANRYLNPLAVVIIDLDRFKSINDTFGHATGDEVIRAVARILWGRCREADAAGRYGGEEFCLILPQTDATGARALCEELRQSIEAYDWKRIHSDLVVTGSFGFSTDTSLPDGESMVKVADNHLYTAKQTGRNRVVG